MSDQENKPWEWGDKGVPHNPINHYPEGTRFLCCGYDGHMGQFSQGNYVRYEDYARLKAELDRLKNTDPNSITDVDIKANPEWAMACFQFHRENERAEIKRLRKAGDNLERVLTTKVASYEVANASHEWRAAKEGKQS